MTEAFTIFLETMLDGRAVKGAGAIRIADEVADIHGQLIEVRRVSLDVLIAYAPRHEPEQVQPLAIGSR